MPTTALISAGIGAAGSLGSAAISSNAAEKAGQQQAAAAQQALDFQKQVYSQNQNNLAPWMNTGSNALYSLASLYGLSTPNNPAGGSEATKGALAEFQKSTPYTFGLEQGNKQLQYNLNATGKQQSGAQALATQQYAQGYASQQLGNWMSGLYGLSNSGQQAAGSLANSGVQSAGQIGQSYGNMGTAQAAGTIGAGNAWAGALNNGANNLGNSLALYSALGRGGGGGNGSSTYSLANTGWAGSNSATNPFYGPLNG